MPACADHFPWLAASLRTDTTAGIAAEAPSPEPGIGTRFVTALGAVVKCVQELLRCDARRRPLFDRPIDDWRLRRGRQRRGNGIKAERLRHELRDRRRGNESAGREQHENYPFHGYGPVSR